MSRVAIAPAGDQDEAFEIDLWGEIFTRRAMTKPRKKQYVRALAELDRVAAEADRAMDSLDVDADDYVTRRVEIEMTAEAGMVAAAGALFDTSFDYAGEGNRKPSALIKKRYDAGKIAWDDIEAFITRMSEASLSPPADGGRDD